MCDQLLSDCSTEWRQAICSPLASHPRMHHAQPPLLPPPPPPRAHTPGPLNCLSICQNSTARGGGGVVLVLRWHPHLPLVLWPWPTWYVPEHSLTPARFAKAYHFARALQCKQWSSLSWTRLDQTREYPPQNTAHGPWIWVIARCWTPLWGENSCHNRQRDKDSWQHQVIYKCIATQMVTWGYQLDWLYIYTKIKCTMLSYAQGRDVNKVLGVARNIGPLLPGAIQDP